MMSKEFKDAVKTPVIGMATKAQHHHGGHGGLHRPTPLHARAAACSWHGSCGGDVGPYVMSKELKDAVKASVIGMASKARSIIVAALVVFAGLRHPTLVPPPARGTAPVAVTSAPT
jgi:hypothetical protein